MYQIAQSLLARERPQAEEVGQLGRAVVVSQLNGGCESAACQLVLLQPRDVQLHHSDVVL